MIDAGVLRPPAFAPEISREQVYAAAGTSLAAIQQATDRGKAIEAAARGVARLVADLHSRGQVDGVLGLGGSAGTTIGSAAMRALPFGVPKLMVSTLASGQVKQYVGVRDILMMHSVVDISGLNRISRTVLTNAALAMAGMAARRLDQSRPGEVKPLITASMFGVTTPCVEACRKIVEAEGFEVLVFHATGIGGRMIDAILTNTVLPAISREFLTRTIEGKTLAGVRLAVADGDFRYLFE